MGRRAPGRPLSAGEARPLTRSVLGSMLRVRTEAEKSALGSVAVIGEGSEICCALTRYGDHPRNHLSRSNPFVRDGLNRRCRESSRNRAPPIGRCRVVTERRTEAPSERRGLLPRASPALGTVPSKSRPSSLRHRRFRGRAHVRNWPREAMSAQVFGLQSWRPSERIFRTARQQLSERSTEQRLRTRLDRPRGGKPTKIISRVRELSRSTSSRAEAISNLIRTLGYFSATRRARSGKNLLERAMAAPILSSFGSPPANRLKSL